MNQGMKKDSCDSVSGAVSPMGVSVDAPGAILKYNTDSFYVDFRTHIMDLFPVIKISYLHSHRVTARL